MSLFSCCFKLCSVEDAQNNPTINKISDVLKEPLTNSSIVVIVDELEEAVLEKVLEPVVDGVVKNITGHDISGVIHDFVEKEIEPRVEKLLNAGVNTGLLAIEKVSAPIIIPILDQVETIVVPVLDQVETIVPSFHNGIEDVKIVLNNASTLLASNEK